MNRSVMRDSISIRCALLPPASARSRSSIRDVCVVMRLLTPCLACQAGCETGRTVCDSRYPPGPFGAQQGRQNGRSVVKKRFLLERGAYRQEMGGREAAQSITPRGEEP